MCVLCQCRNLPFKWSQYSSFLTQNQKLIAELNDPVSFNMLQAGGGEINILLAGFFFLLNRVDTVCLKLCRIMEY